MDKLEKYLDQVCRSIAGPKSLREHIRQELREHLLDAVAKYKATGMYDVEALDRALADFGGPEQVRAELEATHGHRVLGVVIDKAMQWQERTMKAKWLWTTWAYLAVVGVIAMELFFILFSNVYLLPKMKKIRSDGILTFDDTAWPVISWLFSFLDRLHWVCERLGWWLLLLTAVLWGLFEWRVRGENKPFMRLAALGTMALGLLVLVLLTSGSLSLPFMVGLPPVGRMQNRLTAIDQIGTIDESVSRLNEALEKNRKGEKMDWETAQENAKRLSEALNKLEAVVPTLATIHDPSLLETLRMQLGDASQNLEEVVQAIRDKKVGMVEWALERFQTSLEPVRKAVLRAAPK